MADLAAVFDQQPPLEHDILAHHEDALFEHRPHLVREPIIQLGAAAGVGDQLDSESDFSERYGAHIEQVERLAADEFQHLAFGVGAAQLRKDIRVEKPTRHKTTWRTGMGARFGSMSISRCGDACIAAISASPVRSPLRRRNSSAEITTTSSRPCTVTCCGPSLRTRRTNSLNRALASCNSQRPDCRSRIRRGFGGLVGDDDFTILVMLTRLP